MSASHPLQARTLTTPNVEYESFEISFSEIFLGELGRLREEREGRGQGADVEHAVRGTACVVKI